VSGPRQQRVVRCVGWWRRLMAHRGGWEAMASTARQRTEVEFNAARQGERLAEIYVAL
jgi:hypothetical protein